MSRIRFFYILLIPLFLVSCKDDRNERAVEALIQEKLEERLTDYEEILMRKCREEILAQAGKIVDSILISEARLAKDTLDRPAKPERPEKPDIKTVLDSTPIAPIIEKNNE